MTDQELSKWWPDLGNVVAELRRSERTAVADLLVDAVCAGATSSEILGGVGTVLHAHRALRPRLSRPAALAWGAVMRDVYRASPGLRLAHWFARMTGGRT